MRPRLLTRWKDFYFAFDKPAGMPVHRCSDKSIADLSAWIKSQRSLPRCLLPVHRLDRATSGVIMCAAGSKARAKVNEWLNDAKTNKRYIALVAGSPARSAGVFNKPLFDRRRGRLLEAASYYRVRESLPHGFSLLDLELSTGRKHQLRRHLADAGLPIVGDMRYGPKRPKRIPHFPNRLWLHACELQLPDRVITSPLPLELQDHLKLLHGLASC